MLIKKIGVLGKRTEVYEGVLDLFREVIYYFPFTCKMQDVNNDTNEPLRNYIQKKL